MYKATINTFGGESSCVIRTTDGACIPFDPANSDYQAYLLWISEGNAPIGADTPLPADVTKVTNEVAQ